MECDLLSVMSIYPRIFLRLFNMYRLFVGFLFVLYYKDTLKLNLKQCGIHPESLSSAPLN